MRHYFFLFFLLFCSIVKGGTIDPNTPDSKYLEFGQKFKSVVRICAKYNDIKNHQSKSNYGSAVVIDKHWIVTSAHIVKQCESAIIIVDNKEYCLEKVIIHKDFDPNIFGCHDIALGFSKNEIPCENIPELYTDTDELGKFCVIAGYGITGTFNSEMRISDGKKRGGTNIIHGIVLKEQLLVCNPSRPNDKSKTDLEILICNGDSGGGLFIDEKLAGIHYCVSANDDKADSDYDDDSCHVRVSSYVDWIKKNISGEKSEDKVISLNSLEIDNNIYYIITLSCAIGLNILCFILGYIWCKMNSIENLQSNYSTITNKINKNIKSTLVPIDNSKVVIDIKTDGLEKKYSSLGDTKNTTENISSSINKLKNLKG